MYSKYGTSIRFSMWKATMKVIDGILVICKFLCSKKVYSSNTLAKSKSRKGKARKIIDVRCGCEAMISLGRVGKFEK